MLYYLIEQVKKEILQGVTCMRTLFHIWLINKDSSDAYRANTGNFSKKIAERQQIIIE